MKADQVSSTHPAGPMGIGFRAARRPAEGEAVKAPAVVVEPISTAARQSGAGPLAELASTGRIVRVVV